MSSNMIEDKKVGELWLWAIGVEPDGEEHTFTVVEMKNVIRKLVEERSKEAGGREIALRSFGIDPATFKE